MGRSSSTTLPENRRKGVSLPVVGEGVDRTTIRPSRMSRRRAWVLGIFQLLMIAHIVQWLITGRTTTPIEPSESMEFTSDGIVNAGLIFFSLALLSTLIFGRWMCGWMCHLVLLQDLCGWMMKKLGVRPKPFRSRLLIYIPLVLALYMFIWPMVFRWGVLPLDARLGSSLGAENWFVQGYRGVFAFGGVQLPMPRVAEWQLRFEMTTDDFWHTFAGVAVAIPFLLICGFGCVYLLGAKGFCTYGCPYGGFFAPLDKVAVGRIRVTDACEQCGHCTAVCTSNVRVSEEVNAYGMVVDPGCMKCMDCVSVCPNDALYFGFGPSAIRKSAKSEAPPRHYDLSWRGEIACLTVFAVCFFATRGVYGPGFMPMLMAGGIAACLTFIFYKAWQTVSEANVRFHKFQLRLNNATMRAGWVFRVSAIFLAVLVVHSLAVRSIKALASYHDTLVRIAPQQVFSENPQQLGPEMDRAAGRALKLYSLGSSMRMGGIGLLATDQASIDARRAWLHATRQNFDAADAILLASIDAVGPQPGLCVPRLQILATQGRHDELLEWAGDLLATEQDLMSLLDALVQWSDAEDREHDVISICERRLERFPEDLHTMRWLSLLLLEVGELERGIALIEKTIEIDPTSAGAYEYLARGYRQRGDDIAAERALRDGIATVSEQASENLHRLLGQLLHQQGATQEAREHLDKAAKLRIRREGDAPTE